MASEQPYISADRNLPEFTSRAIITGILLGILLTAANAYLGLKVGMTVSASIPAAVMSMLVLRGLRMKNVSILENNVVQTMASSGESLAAGVIFTIPAMLVMEIWTDIGPIQMAETFVIAFLGGVLGTMFTVTLRRVFIVEEALPYPEGVACREVLVAGEEGGGGFFAIIYALIFGAVYGWFVKGFHITRETVDGAVNFVGTRLFFGSELSLALLSVGYIVGLRIASFIFLGGVIGFVVLVPIFGMIHGWPAGVSASDGFYILWSQQIRFVGVGAMVVGGVWTLFSMRSTIMTGFSKAFSSIDTSGDSVEFIRTDKDLDIRIVLITCASIALLTFIYYWVRTGSLLLAIAGAMFLAVTAFFFSAVAGYIAGVVGSSNSPVSGMTIATLMFAAIVVYVVGGQIIGMPDEDLKIATLIIAAVVAVNAAIAGDVMQDLKTGNMVGATPWLQQISEVIGVVVAAIIIGPILFLLNGAYRITGKHCNDTNARLEEEWEAAGSVGAEPDYYDCSEALLAPQADLIGTIIDGIFGGNLNLPMIVLGGLIAALIIWKKLPVMSVAIGIYLPLTLSVPIITGGILCWLITGTAKLRIDGKVLENHSEQAEKVASSVSDRGILIGAGLIAGESIIGVVLALLLFISDRVTWLAKPNEWLPLGELPLILSLAFFGWFVGVFVFLATRTLPRGTSPLSLLSDWLILITEGGKRLFNSIKPP